MESMGLLETILLGALAVFVIFWFRPGIKASLEASKNAEKDWQGALIPIGIVVLFVIMLIALVR
jgi:hypothetical protein